METDTQFVDYTALPYNVTDLNEITSRVFVPESYNFTVGDLYQAKEITMSVEDAAGQQATCKFQYLALRKYIKWVARKFLLKK